MLSSTDIELDAWDMAKGERPPRSEVERRIIEFTMEQTLDEYKAQAMMLGMNYGPMHHLYTSPEVVLDPDTMTELPLGSVIYITRIKLVARMRELQRGE